MVAVRHAQVKDELSSSLNAGLEQIQELPSLILYGVIGIIVIVAGICIYVQYKRYLTREQYDQTP
jgi:cell division protein FtsL